MQKKGGEGDLVEIMRVLSFVRNAVSHCKFDKLGTRTRRGLVAHVLRAAHIVCVRARCAAELEEAGRIGAALAALPAEDESGERWAPRTSGESPAAQGFNYYRVNVVDISRGEAGPEAVCVHADGSVRAYRVSGDLAAMADTDPRLWTPFSARVAIDGGAIVAHGRLPPFAGRARTSRISDALEVRDAVLHYVSTSCQKVGLLVAPPGRPSFARERVAVDVPLTHVAPRLLERMMRGSKVVARTMVRVVHMPQQAGCKYFLRCAPRFAASFSPLSNADEWEVVPGVEPLRMEGWGFPCVHPGERMHKVFSPLDLGEGRFSFELQLRNDHWRVNEDTLERLGDAPDANAGGAELASAGESDSE